MLVHTAGIILRSTKYGDTSLIVEVLTPAQGRCTIMVKGARKPNKAGATKAGILQPGFLVQLSMLYQGTKPMQVANDFAADSVCMRQLSMAQLGVITFITEILEKCLHGSELDADIFDCYWEILLHCYSVPEDIKHIPIHAVLQLAHHLGFQITGAHSALTPTLNLQAGAFDMQAAQNNIDYAHGHAAQLISAINSSTLFTSRINSTREGRKKALDASIKFLEIHLGRTLYLQSVSIWQSVFDA
jgi:DNA repair protein RecO (recombination protein O)